MISMPEKLTPAQAAVMDFLEDREAAGQGLPTLREICGHFGFRSTKAAFDHLRVLKSKGWISLTPHRSRGIRILRSRSGIPILGAIPAGPAWDVEVEVEARLPISPAFFRIADPSRAIALRIRGTSMEGRNLIDGDLVVVERGANPKDHDIVAALIDNETTLKTLILQDGHARLRAENPADRDPEPVWGMEVQGVVRGVLRRV